MTNQSAFEIEKKWQKYWEEEGIYKIKPDSDREKFYMLTMLPYPSGDLHIGHWYAMCPSDAIARFMRMQGYHVFFPMGFDAFGLPAENAAIKNNIHPKEWTYKNIGHMREQLKSMGAMFNWNHEVITCDPEYYKWSQWIFLKFYEKGLAYREYAPVDFCPNCNTTLAREQVVGDDNLCERCDSPVIKKDLNQWKLRITKYADELLNYNNMEWPDRVKNMQINWIGRSEGVEFTLKISGYEDYSFDVFTTRPDTVFGMSFCVLAPEHPLIDKITTPEQKKAVKDYQENAKRKSEIERTSEAKEKDGIFTGAYAINPMNQEKVPIWIADYVLSSYGTGAIMAVPAHDKRDFAFAKKYNLSIPVVIVHKDNKNDIPKSETMEDAFDVKEDSMMVNSTEFSGLIWPQTFNKVADEMEKRGIGKRQVNFRLHDWLISRQRMWGTPIPIIYCDDCGTVPVPFDQLPVYLPDNAEFKPTGESPLKYHDEFRKTKCPKCGKDAERETDTMDTFICSSWYHYGYLSPGWKKGEKLKGDDIPWDRDLANYWLPVDQYTGGIEHATMHLLYFRFFTKALADIGVLPFREPAKRLFNQGMILGEDHEKMSKSRGNVVSPDKIVEEEGADALRAYLMFIGPWEAGGPWHPQGIEGVSRFLNDVSTLAQNTTPAAKNSNNKDDLKQLVKATHQTLKKVTEDFKQFKFNTALAALMSLRNVLKNQISSAIGTEEWDDAIDKLLLMLAPIAPHISEELWQKKHPGKSIHLQLWPKYNEELTREETQVLVVQVNGKLRDRITIPVGLDKKSTEEKALSSEKVQSHIEGKTIRKIIVVQNKLVNIVVS